MPVTNYIAPENYAVPSLRGAFERASPTTWRNAPGHEVLCDHELFPGCGYATEDEARLLYRIAAASMRERDDRIIEIGSHTGWTGAHLLAGALSVNRTASYIGLDPEYRQATHNHTHDPVLFLQRAVDNFRRAGEMLGRPLLDSASFSGRGSDEFIPNAARHDERYRLAFIDGDHSPGLPLRDAKLALSVADDDCVIAFHDTIGDSVQEALKFLIVQGFNARVYRTPQFVSVAWRGDFTMPSHTPDPYFDWRAWMEQLSRSVDLFELSK